MAQETDGTIDELKDLIEGHRGEENAIPSSKISETLGIPDGGSYANTRELVRRLVADEGIPIAATNDGYFVIESHDELYRYLANLRRREDQIRQRARDVLEAAENADHL